MVLMEAVVYGSSFALITWPLREGSAMKVPQYPSEQRATELTLSTQAIVISAACGLTYCLYRRVLLDPNLGLDPHLILRRLDDCCAARIEISKEGVYDVKDLVAP